MEPNVRHWAALAAARTVEAFCAEFAHPFLIGGFERKEGPDPVKASRTLRVDAAELMRHIKEEREHSVVLPIVKRLSTFPSMISIGRTANNDLVFDSPQISKFHALFRVRDGGLDLEDAGSSNGTFVRDTPVVKGTPHKVKSGERIRFGTLLFELHDPASAWAWLTRKL